MVNFLCMGLLDPSYYLRPREGMKEYEMTKALGYQKLLKKPMHTAAGALLGMHHAVAEQQQVMHA